MTASPSKKHNFAHGKANAVSAPAKRKRADSVAASAKQAPAEDLPCPAWVMSTTSNTHVAKDIQWFCADYRPIMSYLTHPMTLASEPVFGIGTVKIPVKVSPDPMIRGHDVLTLHNVLHAPGSICNIIGTPVCDDYDVEIDGGRKTGTISRRDGTLVGFFRPGARFLELRLSGPPVGPPVGPSPFDPNATYMIRFDWPDEERLKWLSTPSPTREALVPTKKPTPKQLSSAREMPPANMANIAKESPAAKKTPVARESPPAKGTPVGSKTPASAPAAKETPPAKKTPAAKEAPVASKTSVVATIETPTPTPAPTKAPTGIENLLEKERLLAREISAAKELLLARKSPAPTIREPPVLRESPAARQTPRVCLPPTPVRREVPTAKATPPEKQPPVAREMPAAKETPSAKAAPPAPETPKQKQTFARPTAEERKWMEKHYGNEYKFLLTFGLKIQNEEDREESLRILRSMVAQDQCQPQSKPQSQPQTQPQTQPQSQPQTQTAERPFKILRKTGPKPDESQAAQLTGAERRWVGRHHPNLGAYMEENGFCRHDKYEVFHAVSAIRAEMTTARYGDDAEEEDAERLLRLFYLQEEEIRWMRQQHQSATAFALKLGLSMSKLEDFEKVQEVARVLMRM